ncbi:MAG: phosphoesterase, partial [Phycisphaerae bacterium]
MLSTHSHARAAAVFIVAVASLTLAQSPATRPSTQTVGPIGDGSTVVPTAQLVRPAGDTVECSGRPIDIALAPDASVLYAKDNRGLVVVHAQTLRILQEVAFAGGGGSMVGIAVSPDGARVYATQSSDGLLEYSVEPDRKLTFKRKITLPGLDGKGASFPCGVSLSRDGKLAYVCLSRNNMLATIDLSTGKLVSQIETGIAPFKVALAPDEKTAYVTCWGGRKPLAIEKTAPSAGSPVAIDARGIATTGGVVAIDLVAGKVTHELETGLSACDLVLSPDASRLFVANANSDTVTVIDTARFAIIEQIVVKPEPTLPFGSMPNGLTIDADGKRLFVSCAGNNAVAVVDVFAKAPAIVGWIPTGWYPGPLVRRDESLFVANIKGVGSRNARETDGSFNSHRHRGSLQRVRIPAGAGAAGAFTAWTAQVRSDAR